MKTHTLMLHMTLILSSATAWSANAAYVCNTSGLTDIHDIQSTGGDSPKEGQTVDVRGTITALDLKDTDENIIQGFYIESPTPDKNPQTSDGIYIKTGDIAQADFSDIQKGYDVCLKGTVDEYYGNSLIDISTDIANQYVIGENVGIPDPIELTIDDGY